MNQVSNALFAARRVSTIGGAANGLSLPSAQVVLAVSEPSDAFALALWRGLDRLKTALEVATLAEADAASENTAPDAVSLGRNWSATLSNALAEVHGGLSSAANANQTIQSVEVRIAAGTRIVKGVLIQWPTHWPNLLAPVLNWALDHWVMLAQPADEDVAVQTVRAYWDKVKEALAKALPPGLNPPRIMIAANCLHMPVSWVDRDIMQVGVGRRARLLRSTLTDTTPSLGAMLARDKARTNKLLRMAGIPVPRHIEVASEAAALTSAQELGWPVVVKPADQDLGKGARANLRSAEQVVAAYANASLASKRVLVEQHIVGREYRLLVAHGALLWAHERAPASIVGDGRLTIQSLIEAENARRSSGLGVNGGGLNQIYLKEEDVLFLEDSGLTLEHVPEERQEIRLQRVPNTFHGGSNPACFDVIHPDNKLIAERAAQLLRLDVAGIDLIMPDISRSWRETGGGITEVNAIPQVNNTSDRNLVPRLLQKLVPGQGRVPLAYVLAAGDAPAWVESLHQRLSQAGLRTGLSTEAGLRIGTDWIRMGRTSAWDDVQAMQMDPTVGAIIVVDDGASFLQTGLPFDAVDALVVAAHVPQVLQLLMPYCQGFKAMVGEGTVQSYGNMLRAQTGTWRVLPDDEQGHQGLVDEAVGVLLAAEAAYARSEPLLPDVVHHPGQ